MGVDAGFEFPARQITGASAAIAGPLDPGEYAEIVKVFYAFVGLLSLYSLEYRETARHHRCACRRRLSRCRHDDACRRFAGVDAIGFAASLAAALAVKIFAVGRRRHLRRLCLLLTPLGRPDGFAPAPASRFRSSPRSARCSPVWRALCRPTPLLIIA